ncbi:hypothetical protein [Nocardioides soli]|uniref:Uncharacterized protein n=1 Tax=Nocardioides soli TaxID=1036020 RepID=A0A7W4VSS8_9ACTN|nr:hypothetical protein [Nocardioides soli]MBB3041152.1 hypothetical protein [Nocardioides soli]
MAADLYLYPVDRIRDYVGESVITKHGAAAFDAAVRAEQMTQAGACRVPADDDETPEAQQIREVLAEALCRRVAVNLARRGLPLGMQMSDVGPARLTTNDPEVRRLEGPYRKLVVG